MDLKRILPLMLVGLGLILIWPMAIQFVGTQLGYDMARPVIPQARESEAPPAAPAEPLASVTAPAPTVAGDTTSGEALRVVGATTSVEHALGSDRPADPRFALQLRTSAIGAGIESVVLNDYRASLRSQDRFLFQNLPAEAPESHLLRSLATRRLVINGTSFDISRVVWRHVRTESTDTQQRVIYALDVMRGETPVLEVLKSFTVFTRSAVGDGATDPSEGPRGFEVSVRHAFFNKTDQPLDVQISVNGPLQPPSENDRGIDKFVQAGFETERVVRVRNVSLASIDARPIDLLEDQEGMPIFFGASSTYFMGLVRPNVPTGSKHTDVINAATTVAVNPGSDSWRRLAQIELSTPAFRVAAAGQSETGVFAFFGPRKRELLTNTHFAAPGVRYDEALVITVGPCGFCTFQWLVGILFVVLKAFHMVTGDWGLAIIGLVCLVRLLLHPITRKSQLSMMKMGKLGPEFERLKKKYGDDKEAMAKAQMELLKQHGATPIMGCLPMVLQMPIWIALWQALNTTFDLRHEPFLYGLTWIQDLSKPDHLIDFADFGWEPIHLFLGITISGLNILPLVLAVTYYISIKIQPQPAAITPEQKQQQAIIKWMTVLMFPTLFYSSPSGLCIYILTSTILGIFESKLVRKQFERMEAEQSKFQIVDAEVVNATTAPAKSKPTEKKGFFARIQEQAEQMQKQIEHQKTQRDKQQRKKK